MRFSGSEKFVPVDQVDRIIDDVVSEYGPSVLQNGESRSSFADTAMVGAYSVIAQPSGLVTGYCGPITEYGVRSEALNAAGLSVEGVALVMPRLLQQEPSSTNTVLPSQFPQR